MSQNAENTKFNFFNNIKNLKIMHNAPKQKNQILQN